MPLGETAYQLNTCMPSITPQPCFHLLFQMYLGPHTPAPCLLLQPAQLCEQLIGVFRDWGLCQHLDAMCHFLERLQNTSPQQSDWHASPIECRSGNQSAAHGRHGCQSTESITSMHRLSLSSRLSLFAFCSSSCRCDSAARHAATSACHCCAAFSTPGPPPLRHSARRTSTAVGSFSVPGPLQPCSVQVSLAGQLQQPGRAPRQRRPQHPPACTSCS